MPAASEYYGDIAALHDLSVPAILSGRQISVADPELRLPIHDVSPERLADRIGTLEANCEKRFGQATTFLRSVVAGDNPQLPFENTNDVPVAPVVPELFTDLVPPTLITGHLTNFRLRAVTRSELPDSIIDNLDKDANNAGRAELFYGTAHFLATAELYSGRTLGRVGRVARLAIIGRHDQDYHLSSIDQTPSMTSYPMTENDRQIMNAMRKSRGRAWWAERKAATNPFSGGTGSGR